MERGARCRRGPTRHRACRSSNRAPGQPALRPPRGPTGRQPRSPPPCVPNSGFRLASARTSIMRLRSGSSTKTRSIASATSSTSSGLTNLAAAIAELPHRTEVGGDHRQTGAHRLEHRQTKPLVKRNVQQTLPTHGTTRTGGRGEPAPKTAHDHRDRGALHERRAVPSASAPPRKIS